VLRLYNALTERVEDFEPPSAPACRLRVWSAGGTATPAQLRLTAFFSCAGRALEHLGLQLEGVEDPRAEVDVHCGLREPAGRALLWLRPEARSRGCDDDLAALGARGFDEDALRLACLKSHYRAELDLSQDSLERAREDSLRLRATANFLRGARGGSAPNVKALAGYKKRLRDALARDLDLPAALGCLWDALRPGALSPGSQLAFLKEAAAVLDLRGL
jgi:hypothetical protein